MPASSDRPGRPSPHDALFRRVLGEPEHAASELRSVLPPALLTRVSANPGLAGELTSWVADLRAVLDRPGGSETFRALVTHIQLVGEVPPDDLQHLMGQVGPEAEEVYMTTADMLEARGEARGRAESLLQLLELRFGPVPDTTAATVRSATAEQIAAWTGRVLTATSPEDVLR